MKSFIKKIKNMSHKQVMLLAADLQQELDKPKPLESSASNESIAIIGMSCRFPGGANTPEHYWNLLITETDAVVEMTDQRWNMDDHYDENRDAPGKIYVKHAGLVDEVDQFDAAFFEISPLEANHMDPQQRLLLEVSWQAFEDAGLVPDSLMGSSTGVFLGMMNHDYSQLVNDISAYTGSGLAHSAAAGRISFNYGLKGPCLTVDTACSSSLVSTHLACQSLRNNECDLALTGGVSLMLSPQSSVAACRASMLSPDGRCKTFDASADGYVRSEGCGVLVLKRLTDAIEDGDDIAAIIRGSSVNQDGRSQGLTAPNGPSQQKVIRTALVDAGLLASQISYVESHGTGTSLGDPIEMGALDAVYGSDPNREKPLVVGAVKSNIGHTESAAGIAGLIKLVLALQHEVIPANIHMDNLNPHIHIDPNHLTLPTQQLGWSKGKSKRIGATSSFGFSGTNAHIIVEEAPTAVVKNSANQVSTLDRPQHLLTLSGKNAAGLLMLAKQYLGKFNQESSTSLADICFSSNTGRTHFSHRLAMIGETELDVYQSLSQFIEDPTDLINLSGVAPERISKMAFLFSGQGSQYIGMGKGLYQSQPTFRKYLDRCAELLVDEMDKPLLSVMWGEDKSVIHQTQYTQPALFSLEYALSQLWLSWGVKPSYVMGHSVGEYAAACLAGVFTLEDAIKLIAARGRLMVQHCEPGDMAVFMTTPESIATTVERFSERVSIAAENGPTNVVISGEPDAIKTIMSEQKALGVRSVLLDVSHAFHSVMMKPMLLEFERVAQSINYKIPAVPFISNITGSLLTQAIADSSYWVNHVCSIVKFSSGMTCLNNQKVGVCLEIGPSNTLLGMGARCITDEERVWTASLGKGSDDWSQILKSLGKLYTRGIAINWNGFDNDYQRIKVSIPSYPFQRKRYWLPDQSLGQSLATSVSTVLKTSPVRDPQWAFKLQWHKKALKSDVDSFRFRQKHWMIYTDSQGVGEALASRLKSEGAQVSLVSPGDCFSSDQRGHYTINPAVVADFERVFRLVNGGDIPLEGIIFSWPLDTSFTGVDSLGGGSLEALIREQEFVCRSALYLVQALATETFSQVPTLCLLTRGAQSLRTDNEGYSETTTELVQAPLIGLSRVIGLEHPELNCTLVDLSVEKDSDQDAEKVMSELIQPELFQSDLEPQIAYRENIRYVARLEENELVTATPAQFSNKVSPDVTYLITGGGGSLGIRFARWLVDNGAKHIRLSGRSGIASKEVQQAISEMISQSVDIQLVKVDVSDHVQVASMIKIIESSHAPLRGVIHAAGVLDDGVLSKQDWSSFERVFAPKISGSWNLHVLTQTIPLDFFVLFSSVSSVVGAIGQGNYAAANSFLDALAHHRCQMGLPALSINWGPWEQGGMATNESAKKRLNRNKMIGFIDADRGLKYFEKLLVGDVTQSMILPINIDEVAEAGVDSDMPLFRELLKNVKPKYLENIQEQSLLQQKIEGNSQVEKRKILQQYIYSVVVDLLGVNSSDEVELKQAFHELGLDSMMAVEMRNLLSRAIGHSLPVSLLFDYPNIEALTDFLETEISGIDADNIKSQSPQLVDALDPIAIIGLSCRYPGGSKSPEEFWETLRDGVDAVSDLGNARWNIEEFYDSRPGTPGKMITRSGGLLDNVDEFDEHFFGVSPKEAESMDPQQRLLLEASWQAIEYAGYSSDKLHGNLGGVFVGIASNDYAQLQQRYTPYSDITGHMGTGSAMSIAAGRIAYFLGWHGPAIATDTACSSSLVSIHLACQSLRNGESNLALAGGVNLTLSPIANISLSQSYMLSPVGRCKTFDSAADGYVRSEGCAMVLLKRLTDAQRDDDNILAMIRGTAVNQDGRSQGLTAPNGPSQEAVITKALAVSGVSPEDIDYVEAHGTGTALGDPIEINALNAIYGKAHSPANPVMVGSVKTNIGHAEAAAGIAGLIKVILALKNEMIPPHLHLNHISEHLGLDKDPRKNAIVIPTTLTPWAVSSKKRFGAVSSFGFGGTNSHVILEEAPQSDLEPTTESIDDEGQYQVIALTAKTEAGLNQLVKEYADYFSLKSSHQNSLVDIAYTANLGRSHFKHRLAIIGNSHESFKKKFVLAQENKASSIILRGQATVVSPEVVFLFTGEGSQYAGMGKELYDSTPLFRDVLDQCETLLEALLEKPLLSVMWGENTDLLDQSQYIQPSLFAIEYALAMCWKSWGVTPAAVMGHSVGEYVAACVAEVFSLEDGLRLIAARGKLMQVLPDDGGMTAVEVSESKELKDFEKIARDITYHSPTVKLISNVSGDFSGKEVSNAEYWINHIIAPVEFMKGVDTLDQAGYKHYLEVGPHPVLLGMLHHCLPHAEFIGLPSLSKNKQDKKEILNTIGSLFVKGVPVNWSELESKKIGRKVVLPTYPFQRNRYWMATEKTNTRIVPGLSHSFKNDHPLLGQKMRQPRSSDIRFESQFSQSSPAYIKDHRLFNIVVVPGASHISMMLAAAKEVFSDDACEISDLSFLQAMVLPEEETRLVQVLISPHNNNDRSLIELVSIGQQEDEQGSDSWILHATASIKKLVVADGFKNSTAVKNEIKHNLKLIEDAKNHWVTALPAEEFYSRFSEVGYNLENSFQWLGDGYVNGNGALRRITIPNLPDQVMDYQLYPGLIDSCFQAMASCGENTTQRLDEDTLYIPFSLESFIQFIPFDESAALWCHAQLRDQTGDSAVLSNSQIGDITLFNNTGEVVAKISRFESRRISRSALEKSLKPKSDNCLYQLEWQPNIIEDNSPIRQIATNTFWLILTEHNAVGCELGSRLSEQGHSCISVLPRESYQRISTCEFHIDPSDPDHFKHLLHEIIDVDGSQCAGILHLWNLDLTSASCIDASSMSNALLLSCGSVLHLTQALADSSEPIPLWVFTRGTHALGKSDEVSAGDWQAIQGPLWGLGRVVRLEHPNIPMTQIDLDPKVRLGTDAEEINRILKEIFSSDDEDQLAYRDGQRYVARIIEASVEESSRTLSLRIKAIKTKALKGDRTYLITGGLGALGLKTAQWMVDNGAKHLVLITRSKASEEKLGVLDVLKERGVEVLVAQADVSDYEQMAAVMQEIKNVMSPLGGIVHGAGVLDDGLLYQQNWSRFEGVFSAKVMGTWNLHKLTNNMAIDFFICFSSMASMLGAPGQGNYAAANAYMDSLMNHRSMSGLAGLSINWGAWAESGMAAQLDPEEQNRQRSRGIEPLSTEVAFSILNSAIQEEYTTQIGAFPVDWSRFLQSFSGSVPPVLRSVLKEKHPSTNIVSIQSKDIPLIQKLEIASKNERQSLLEEVVEDLLGDILGLDSIDKQEPLNLLGVDSLMAMTFQSSFRDLLGLDVPPVKLLEGYSIQTLVLTLVESLTDKIFKEMLSAEGQKEVSGEGEKFERIDLRKVKTTAGIELDEIDFESVDVESVDVENLDVEEMDIEEIEI